MNRFFICVFLSLFLVVSGAACAAIRPSAGNDPLTASGMIEADSVRVSAEIGGKIQQMNADRGDTVQPGEVLFRLDGAAIQAQRDQAAAGLQAAQAQLAMAQANLNLLKAGPTTAQVQAAQAELAQAEANRQAVQAELYQATSGSRLEDITAAQARLDRARQDYQNLTVVFDPGQVENVHSVVLQAESNLDQARSRQEQAQKDARTPSAALDAAANTIADAQTLLDSANRAYQVTQDASKPFYQQVAAVRETWDLSQRNLSQAQARQNALRTSADGFQGALDNAQSTLHDAQTILDKAKTAYDGLAHGEPADRLNAAWDQVQSAQAALNALGQFGSGTSLETMLDQLNAATAQRDVANANLENIKSGPQAGQVAAAQAQVDAAHAQVAAAKAALQQIDLQLGKLAVAAPVGGIVLNRSANAGEIAAPGAPLFEIGSLDTVHLQVYIPEDVYGQVRLGQPVTVRVDSFPNRVFNGTVSYIADQAEFTPRNVQTKETRSTTVYAVDIRLSNLDHALKPGMPADASF